VSELVDALVTAYDTPREVLSADVARLLDQLDAAGALEVVGPGEPA
jgi:hypothetical protein